MRPSPTACPAEISTHPRPQSPRDQNKVPKRVREQFLEGPRISLSPALSSASFSLAALNPPVFQKLPGVFFNSQVHPHPIARGNWILASAFVTRPLPRPSSGAPLAIRPPASLPHGLQLAGPFLWHVWHVPSVCRLSCSLHAPFQGMTKERKEWLLLHSLLLLMSARTKPAGPANISAELGRRKRRRNPSVSVLEGPLELINFTLAQHRGPPPKSCKPGTRFERLSGILNAGVSLGGYPFWPWNSDK